MNEAFIKALKWGVMVVFVIAGIYGLAAAGEKDDFRYIMATVLSFGAVSLMFRNWSELPGKIMAFSALLVVILAVIARDEILSYYFYRISDQIWPLGYYQSWAVLAMTLGVITMTFIFKKFDD
ncbi:MAG: hypothetical protein ACLFR0_05075 [Alphaproteobacteria bacterium]